MELVKFVQLDLLLHLMDLPAQLAEPMKFFPMANVFVNLDMPTTQLTSAQSALH